MNVLTLGLGAFGFAISKVLGENNPDMIFYGYGINQEITDSLKQTGEHPYFFNGYKLPDNIKIIDKASDYDLLIPNIDLLILAIPAQAISGEIDALKHKLKPGVNILNLAKGIDVQTNYPISKLIAYKLGDFDYNYFVLSGGMIAKEVVEGKMLGADLAFLDNNNGIFIQGLLENENLKIKIVNDLVNVELYGCLKNIMAILIGYYEGKGEGSSSIGYYLVNFYDEMKEIVKMYGGNGVFDFSHYSLGGDIIASCFGDSRNRYFGELLGKGLTINEVIKKLESENKHSEGYETLRALYPIIKDKQGFEITKFLYSLVS